MINTQLYRESLPSKKRKLYDVIVDGIINHDSEIYLISEEELPKDMLTFVDNDQPQLFDYTGSNINSCGNRIVLKPIYIYSKGQYLKIRQECIIRSKEIISKITAGDDYTKEQQIHDWMCRNLIYEDAGDESHTVVGPLLNGKGVCEGFAKLFKLFMDMLNIPCIVCTGRSNSGRSSENHAWNCVKINGSWYNIDVTYDLTTSPKPHVRHDYFNLTDKQISIDHHNTYPLVHCTSEIMNYFVKNNLLMQNQEDLVRYLRKKGRFITFRIPDQANYAKATENVKKILSTRPVGLIPTTYTLYFNEAQHVFCVEFSTLLM